MKLKYTYFETREQYEEAVSSDFQAAWKVCDVDHDSIEDFAEYMENVIIDDTAPECSEEVHILVADQGNASDDFRDYHPHHGCDQMDYASILTYFAEKRESDMQALVTLARKDYEHLYEKLTRFFHVYERYSVEVRGELSDEEAVETALNSTDGVREVIYSKKPLEVTLRKDVWQGKTGTTTSVDYFLEV